MKTSTLACTLALTYLAVAAPFATAQHRELTAAGLPFQMLPNTLTVWSAGSGDVDADGDIDLLVLRQDVEGIASVSALGLLRADGNGGYAPLEDLVVVPQEQRIWDVGTPLRFEDLTGDGEPDIFAPNAGVFPGLGGGQFAPLVPLQAEDTLLLVQEILVGEIDGDGQPDLLLQGFASETTTTEWVVFLGHADGSFSAQPLGSFGLPTSGPAPLGHLIALRDLDADGDDDLLSLNCVDQGGLSTRVVLSHLNDGSGAFAAPFTAASFVDCAAEIGIAPGPLHDFDGDGVLDLLVRRTDQATLDPVTQASVYRGDGAGAFAPSGEVLRSAELLGGGRALAGDLDGDGAVDLALPVHPYTLGLFRGAGDLSFESSTRVSLDSALSLPFAHIARLNADARDDIVAITEVQVGTTTLFALVPAFGSPTPFVDLGFGGGAAQLTLSGSTQPGAAVELQLQGVAHGTQALLALSLDAQPISFSSGTLIPDATPRFLITAGETLRTRWPTDLPASTQLSPTIYVQALTSGANGLQLSNAIAAVQQ